MSIGAPSNLSTLLVQRLDAALGTSLGQQASLANGAGPLAVPQPGDPENPGALQNPPQRSTREAVDQAATQDQQRAAVGKATRELQLDNLLGRATTLHTVTQSAPTTLGYAARIILALLNAYPEAEPAIRAQAPLLPGSPQSPSAAGASPTAEPASGTASSSAGSSGTGSPPVGSPATGNPIQTAGAGPAGGPLAAVLNQPGALVARLATALMQSVQTSGLFYESHLAQLAAGQSSPRALRQEPQGQIAPQSAQTAQRSDLAASSNPGNASPGALPSVETSAAHQGTNLPQLATNPLSGPSLATSTAVPGIDAQAQGLVRQQLDVLANQGFAWQGEAWPGAAMHWEVRRRDAGDSGHRDFEDNHWATQLTLSLPTLGNIQARLSLAGDHLVMRLTAPQSAQRLSGSIEALRTRLLAKGLRASQLSVTSHEESADASAPRPHAASPA